MSKVKTFIISILIPVAVGLVVGIITSPSLEYANLQKPILAPQGWVFPVVWTILYVLMGVSYGILKIKGLTNDEIDRAYYTQLIVNALWSVFFFNLGWRLFAFIWLLLLIVLVINIITKFYKKNKLAGLLQIPYLLWTLFAGYLNLAFYILNRW